MFIRSQLCLFIGFSFMDRSSQVFSSHDQLSPYELHQHQETLNKILWAILLVSIPLGWLDFLFGATLPALVIFSLAPVSLIALLLNRNGLYNLAGGLISCLFLIAILFDIYQAGGLTTDLGAVAFPVFIAVCSLLFGKRGIYLFSTITILSIITLGIFEFGGLIRGPGVTDIYDLATVVILVFGMSVILWIMIDNNNKNLQRIKNDDKTLRVSYELTLEGLAKALEYRDLETQNHSSRVVEMSVRLALAMGLNNDEIANIKRGAILHDIGKLAIPDSILKKPEMLTDEEWVIMKTHPTKALEILENIPFLKPALDIPYCHHENWDGTGYPRGISGEQIPLSARIFMIIDQWEALTDDRVYRKAWPYEKVIQHIKDNTNKLYDPQIANTFLNLLKTDAEGFCSCDLDGPIPADMI